MGRKLYFDKVCGVEAYAMCEDGVLYEYLLEAEEKGAAVGNIYKGKVTDVISGMEAAFIDCGLERHCYLSTACADDENKVAGFDTGVIKKPDLNVGDEIMVQVTKPAIGKKGAKVTTNISFVGKYTVYLPDTSFVGVSLKISDEELRNNLLFSAKNHIMDGEGIIVRTAAPYAKLADKAVEVDFFRNIYKNICERFPQAAVGELLYSESPLHIRVLRDMLLSAGDEIHVGNERIFNSVKGLPDACRGRLGVPIIYHDPHRDLFFSEGISAQVMKTLQPKVELQNGAYIVIETTEALTVVDVNTGKYTGGETLEQTVFATNVLAVHELVRQIRLRNLGGIFVVDFIDMEKEEHKKAIVQELERALRDDKGRCKVLPMSKFGLVEFTRKRTGLAAFEFKKRRCKTCGSENALRSLESLSNEFRARLLDILFGGATTVCADINYDVANFIFYSERSEEFRSSIAALYPAARVYIISHRTYRDDQMQFRNVSANGFSLPEGTVLLY